MTAFQYDFTLANKHQWEQGITQTIQFEYFTDAAGVVPKDLTGFTARMHIRDAADTATFILELTTEGPGGDNIVLGDAAGTIVLHVSETTMKALPAPFKGVYDIELIESGAVERFAEGKLEITPEITR